MAKYSDDAKYVSAFNAAQKADNKARLLLQDLNRATPGTAKHTELKAKYDAAKALFKREEDKRIARKAEIDNAVAKEKTKKETSFFFQLQNHYLWISRCIYSMRMNVSEYFLPFLFLLVIQVIQFYENPYQHTPHYC